MEYDPQTSLSKGGRTSDKQLHISLSSRHEKAFDMYHKESRIEFS